MGGAQGGSNALAPGKQRVRTAISAPLQAGTRDGTAATTEGLAPCRARKWLTRAAQQKGTGRGVQRHF